MQTLTMTWTLDQPNFVRIPWNGVFNCAGGLFHWKAAERVGWHVVSLLALRANA